MATPDDALVIARTFEGLIGTMPHTAVVSITSNTPPTVHRWHAFGWKVIATEIQSL